MLKAMESTNPILPPDLEAVVEASHGGPVAVPGKHGRYVIMNADLYGGVMNANAQELAGSVAAIKRSLAQAAAGQTRDIDEALDDLDARYAS